MSNTSLECIRKQLNLSKPKENLKFLIVCPTTLIENWIKEFNIWGYFRYSKFHGSETERKDALKKLENNRCEIVLTTFETCSRHINRLKGLKLAAVIVDEFHSNLQYTNIINFFINSFIIYNLEMKNDESDVAKNLREFSTKVRIGLSGTIIQNETNELWSLVDWY